VESILYDRPVHPQSCGPIDLFPLMNRPRFIIDAISRIRIPFLTSFASPQSQRRNGRRRYSRLPGPNGKDLETGINICQFCPEQKIKSHVETTFAKRLTPAILRIVPLNVSRKRPRPGRQDRCKERRILHGIILKSASWIRTMSPVASLSPCLIPASYLVHFMMNDRTPDRV